MGNFSVMFYVCVLLCLGQESQSRSEGGNPFVRKAVVESNKILDDVASADEKINRFIGDVHTGLVKSLITARTFMQLGETMINQSPLAGVKTRATEEMIEGMQKCAESKIDEIDNMVRSIVRSSEDLLTFLPKSMVELGDCESQGLPCYANRALAMASTVTDAAINARSAVEKAVSMATVITRDMSSCTQETMKTYAAKSAMSGHN